MNNELIKLMKNVLAESSTELITTGSITKAGIQAVKTVIGEFVDTAGEYICKELSNKEASRVQNSIEYITNRISAKLIIGELPGDIQLSNKSNRAPSSEMCEAVLRTCKEEYEELKQKYISNIYVSALFLNDFSYDEIFYRITLAQKITYRQLCILKGISLLEEKDVFTNQGFGNSKITPYEDGILIEVMELYTMGLVDFIHPETKSSFGMLGMNTYKDVLPECLVLSYSGQRQFELMELNDLDDDIVKHFLDLMTKATERS